MQEHNKEFDINEIYETLPQEARMLLVAMSATSHIVGANMELYKNMPALYNEVNLEGQMRLLVKLGLAQRGRVIENQEFTLDEEGDRFRLTEEIRKEVMLKIVKLPLDKVEEALKITL